MTKQEKVAAWMAELGFKFHPTEWPSGTYGYFTKDGGTSTTIQSATFFYDVVEEAKQNLLYKFDEQLGAIPSSQEVVKYADHLRGRIDQKLEIREWIAGQLPHLKQEGKTNE